jgi:hypothetical protein
MLRQIQLLVGSMMIALVLLAVVLVLALPDDELAAAPLWLLAAQFAAGAVIHVVIESIGYRTPAIHVETDEATAADEAYNAFQSRTILRSSLAELVALGSVPFAFILDEGGITGFAIGAGVSLALAAVHAWPWNRPVAKTIASLEREGGRSHLREKLGLPTVVDGPVREV